MNQKSNIIESLKQKLNSEASEIVEKEVSDVPSNNLKPYNPETKNREKRKNYRFWVLLSVLIFSCVGLCIITGFDIHFQYENKNVILPSLIIITTLFASLITTIIGFMIGSSID